MPIEYYEILSSIDMARKDVILPRTESLIKAIESNAEYSLINLKKHTDNGVEYIIVEVTLDGVPSRNLLGISYKERLVLCIPPETEKLIEVYTLRKDFPLLPHQNHRGIGTPRSLCLYFEPPMSVSRTWTAPKFLQRIQWWLEASAKNELHPSDQPIENLYFESNDELILPYNFLHSKDNSSQKLYIVQRSVRKDKGNTFVTDTEPVAGKQFKIDLLLLNLPPIINTGIEPFPTTLEQLNEQLKNRGIDFLEILKSAISEKVITSGIEKGADGEFSVILLSVPLCRDNKMEVEKIQYRAFITNTGYLKIGQDLGALFYLESNYRYYNVSEVGDHSASDAWKSIEIDPITTLFENSKSSARTYSGINDIGPKGTLIGVGSLGSEMLNLWSRSGWGEWTVIDKDHIKPHNISRHTAFRYHVGHSKAEVASSMHRASIAEGVVTPIVGDVCESSDTKISESIANAELVIDASTTLEYPRKSSSQDDIPRHMSVFITPNGNSAVQLTEDKTRKIRLRTLEAQYYRAIIQNDWGKEHLKSNLMKFWSGASCRDVSVALPYSKITIFAATLTESIQLSTTDHNASIKVWERNEGSGSIQAYQVPVYSEIGLINGGMTLFFDEGLKQELIQFRSLSLPNETGGILLGYYDLNINAVVIVCALPAPADSKASHSMFERGIKDTEQMISEISKRTAGIVGYIGEWHSHPDGHSSNPSTHDFIQLKYLAENMAAEGLPAIQLIVGENDILIIQGSIE